MQWKWISRLTCDPPRWPWSPVFRFKHFAQVRVVNHGLLLNLKERCQQKPSHTKPYLWPDPSCQQSLVIPFVPSTFSCLKQMFDYFEALQGKLFWWKCLRLYQTDMRKPVSMQAMLADNLFKKLWTFLLKTQVRQNISQIGCRSDNLMLD